MTHNGNTATTADSLNDPFVKHDYSRCPLDHIEMTERLQVMKQQEDAVLYRDYFQDTASDMPTDCRTKMCEWCFQMVELCHYSRETVDLTISFVDRFFSLSKLQGLSHFQLVAMTCFCMAVKVFEPLKIKVDDVVQLSQGQYTTAHVFDMERTLLQTLQWRLHGPPTKWSWAQHVLAICGYWGSSDAAMTGTRCRRIQELTLFQTQVAVGDYEVWQRQWRPSTIAMASLWNALETVGTSREEVLQCVSRIRRYGGGVLDPLSPDVTHAKARLLRRGGGRKHLAENALALPEEMAKADKSAQDTLPHHHHRRSHHHNNNDWNSGSSNNMNHNWETALTRSSSVWDCSLSHEAASSSPPPPQDDNHDDNDEEWLLQVVKQRHCVNVDEQKATRTKRKVAKTKNNLCSSSSSPICVSRPPTTPTTTAAATPSKRKQPHVHKDQYKQQRYCDANDKTRHPSLRKR